MAISQAAKAMEYMGYARHCLNTMMKIPDQESRIVHREMAAEWFKLAGQAAKEDAAPVVANGYTGKSASRA
jgi:hypothetical protein